jgi:hypothetical protein|tara:strand:+ start:419 stop:703 length:285 start_codon:yes stop_codon:yes gene_type:complete
MGDNLKKIRDIIETMNKIQQVHILKILKDNNIEYSENSNGIFVNMTLLNNQTLVRIKNFIKYVHLQEKQLETFEDIKTKYHNTYYKDNKENQTY